MTILLFFMELTKQDQFCVLRILQQEEKNGGFFSQLNYIFKEELT